MKRWIRKWPETAFTAAFAGLVAAISVALRLPFKLPGGSEAAFVGIHYLYPLIGLAVWGAFALMGQRRNLTKTFLVALPCYAGVLVCHFNLKLWIPHITPALWDDLYWQTDLALRPVVEACFALREAIAPVIPLESNFYMVAFIAMFYLSFCFHALRDPHQFRTLFLAALFLQGMGAAAYLAMPAIGPFLFESGIEPKQTSAQLSMLAAYRDNVAGGASWIAANGDTHLTVGLAAMPSLHTGGSFLFLLFAWRYARVLVPLYLALFAFISVDAVASRWHYLIDLPVGVALAFLCALVAERLNARPTEVQAPAIAQQQDVVLALVARLRHKLSNARTG